MRISFKIRDHCCAFNLVNEPWAVVCMMEGFRELIKLWNEFIARDGDSPKMTIAKATNELEIYIDVAKSSAKVVVSKKRRPDTIVGIHRGYIFIGFCLAKSCEDNNLI